MANPPKDKWPFKLGICAGAFGGHRSAKAIERLNSVVSEIKAISVARRKDCPWRE